MFLYSKALENFTDNSRVPLLPGKDLIALRIPTVFRGSKSKKGREQNEKKTERADSLTVLSGPLLAHRERLLQTGPPSAMHMDNVDNDNNDSIIIIIIIIVMVTTRITTRARASTHTHAHEHARARARLSKLYLSVLVILNLTPATSNIQLFFVGVFLFVLKAIDLAPPPPPPRPLPPLYLTPRSVSASVSATVVLHGVLLLAERDFNQLKCDAKLHAGRLSIAESRIPLVQRHHG